MTSSSQAAAPALDYAALWTSAQRLHPIYVEMAREFVIEVPPCAGLETAPDSPDRETVEHAQKWLHDMDERIQVHQLRQFLQTSSLVDRDGIVAMMQHLLGRATHTDSARDKVDFLLVQYFSQIAPTELADSAADLAYVTQTLEPVLGKVELKAPVWLNGLDRVLDSARKCRSLDDLLHGGILEQGRKAKKQAGELFYMPVALVAFTRFGYLMRRVFFRLMLTDLNTILDGLTELEEKGVTTLDCRRAQFSAQEPVARLRMICQSWKVMFQAEYSSGQPLRMLVDLRASVETALGRGPAGQDSEKNLEKTAAAKGAVGGSVKPAAAAASAAAASGPKKPAAPVAAKSGTAKSVPEPPAAVKTEAPEFEISAETPEWDSDEAAKPGK
jgi:hypothetical protein